MNAKRNFRFFFKFNTTSFSFFFLLSWKCDKPLHEHHPQQQQQQHSNVTNGLNNVQVLNNNDNNNNNKKINK